MGHINQIASILAYSTLLYFNDPIKACNYLRNTEYKDINPEIYKLQKNYDLVMKAVIEMNK